MSYDEYLAWPGIEGRSEWVDGTAIIFAPSTYKHANLQTGLGVLLRLFAKRRDLGTVLATPVEMRILDPLVSRQPDIVFVATAHMGRFDDDRLDGPDDLVVEIVSDETIGRDRGDKFDEYERAGVGEYWIADPRPGRHRFDAWVLRDNMYRTALPEDDGRYHSKVLAGFWLRPDWLWKVPLPSELVLLDEILRIDLSKT